MSTMPFFACHALCRERLWPAKTRLVDKWILRLQKSHQSERQKGLWAHLESWNHKASHLKAEDFLKNHQEQGNPAADLLGTKNKEQIARNRKQAILGTKISGEKLCPFPRASREVRPWESKQMPRCFFGVIDMLSAFDPEIKKFYDDFNAGQASGS